MRAQMGAKRGVKRPPFASAVMTLVNAGIKVLRGN